MENRITPSEMNAEQKQKLFDYFQQEHDIMLLDGDFNEIENMLSSPVSGKWLKRLIGWLKCLRGYHDFHILIYFDDNVQKIICERCGKMFGINHSVKAILPWDAELEKAMKIAYPEK